jgi:hypothetical protein
VKAMRDRNLAVPDVEPAGSRIATVAISAGCVAVALTSAATPASAHVKWLVTCNPSDDPLPLQAVFTGAFWLFLTLCLALFYCACEIEDTRAGSYFSGVLDRFTAPLHQRADTLLRASMAVSFALLWAEGSVILTPDLRDNHAWLSTMQVLVAVFVSARATLPAAAAAVLVLYSYGVATYGLFHMLDYLFFLGLAAYFALSVSKDLRLESFRFDCLRWSIALSLMWPSMENFLYPSWVAPVALAHPQITLGFDVDTFITALGNVEFGLAFALLWTPLVRRFAAAVLAVLLSAVSFSLGKIDAMGHLMIVVILLLVFADPGKKNVRCRPEIAPVVGGTALLAFIFLYAGGHVLYYGPREAALVPLMSGASLLTVGLLCLRSPRIIANRASSVVRIPRADRRRVKHDQPDVLTLERPRHAALPAPMMRYESFMSRLLAVGPPPEHVPPTRHLGNLSMTRVWPQIQPKESGDQSDSAA